MIAAAIIYVISIQFETSDTLFSSCFKHKQTNMINIHCFQQRNDWFIAIHSLVRIHDFSEFDSLHCDLSSHNQSTFKCWHWPSKCLQSSTVEKNWIEAVHRSFSKYWCFKLFWPGCFVRFFPKFGTDGEVLQCQHCWWYLHWINMIILYRTLIIGSI